MFKGECRNCQSRRRTAVYYLSCCQRAQCKASSRMALGDLMDRKSSHARASTSRGNKVCSSTFAHHCGRWTQFDPRCPLGCSSRLGSRSPARLPLMVNNVCGTSCLCSTATPSFAFQNPTRAPCSWHADPAEILEKRSDKGELFFYVHYLDCKCQPHKSRLAMIYIVLLSCCSSALTFGSSP